MAGERARRPAVLAARLTMHDRSGQSHCRWEDAASRARGGCGGDKRDETSFPWDQWGLGEDNHQGRRASSPDDGGEPFSSSTESCCPNMAFREAMLLRWAAFALWAMVLHLFPSSPEEREEYIRSQSLAELTLARGTTERGATGTPPVGTSLRQFISAHLTELLTKFHDSPARDSGNPNPI